MHGLCRHYCVWNNGTHPIKNMTSYCKCVDRRNVDLVVHFWWFADNNRIFHNIDPKMLMRIKSGHILSLSFLSVSLPVCIFHHLCRHPLHWFFFPLFSAPPFLAFDPPLAIWLISLLWGISFESHALLHTHTRPPTPPTGDSLLAVSMVTSLLIVSSEVWLFNFSGAVDENVRGILVISLCVF